jgi:lipopolysaccharide/colanic/teichoic acid biosynthesis glycosyltransferase
LGTQRGERPWGGRLRLLRAAARADGLCDRLLAPAAGAVVVLATTTSRTSRADAACAFLLLAVIAHGMRSQRRRAALCPLVATVYAAVEGLAAVAGILALQLSTGRPELPPLAFALLAATVALATHHPTETILRLLGFGSIPTRIAYVGSERGAARMSRALDRAAADRYTVVGWIGPPGEDAGGPPLPLGPSDRLRELILRHRIDLLVLAPRASRLELCEQLASSCLDLPVHFVDYADFCEEALGHVPMSEIDATWFEHFLRMGDPPSRLAKRAIDVACGALLTIAAAPVIGMLAVLVRRDGGPAFFTQERIGEQGQPFKLIKLRTMRVGVSSDWADGDRDPRVTPLGRVLRRTHLDELPEVMHVIRGEMSLVGPRPEQPVHVARLERALPFYDRRHLIKPGLTGWAALRCGYGGSDAGSAWKLCHDMYYIKHRSVGFDLLILWETAAELLTGRGVSPDEVSSMLEIQLGEPGAALPVPVAPKPLGSAAGFAATMDYER